MNRWPMTMAVAGACLLAGASPRSTAQDKSQGQAARVTVLLPSPSAELWFNGARMAAAGTTRTFTTTPLRPGQDYHYKVRARWYQDGQLVDAFRTVPVVAGRDARVDFRDALAGATTRVYVPVPVPDYVPVYEHMARASDASAPLQWRTSGGIPEP